MAKSPTYSCISYELFVGGEKGNDDNNKEKMSIRSVEVESESVSVIQRQPAPTTAPATKVRKVSTVSTTQLANVLSKFFILSLSISIQLLITTNKQTKSKTKNPNICTQNCYKLQ